LVHPVRAQLVVGVEMQAEELRLENWDVFFVPWYLPAVVEIMAMFMCPSNVSRSWRQSCGLAG